MSDPFGPQDQEGRDGAKIVLTIYYFLALGPAPEICELILDL